MNALPNDTPPDSTQDIDDICKSLSPKPKHKKYDPTTLAVKRLDTPRQALNMIGKIIRRVARHDMQITEGKTLVSMLHIYIQADDLIKRNSEIEERIKKIEELYGVIDPR